MPTMSQSASALQMVLPRSETAPDLASAVEHVALLLSPSAAGLNDQALNSYYCRSDLVPVAESYLSSCVASACSSGIMDIGSAINQYTDYCSSTAAGPTPITLFATTTQGGVASIFATLCHRPSG